MTLSKEIIEILEYIGGKFGIAIDWSSENVMPYLQTLCEKYIAWETTTSIAWLVIGIIVVIAGLLSLRFDLYGIQYSLLVIAGIIGIPVIIVEVFDIIKCSTFPELKILEFLKMKMEAM